MDPRWTAVATLTRGLARLVEGMRYSVPPLDDFDVEILKARWYLDEIQKVVRDIREEERRAAVRLVYGSTTTGKLLE